MSHVPPPVAGSSSRMGPGGASVVRCRSCQALIYWDVTPRGRAFPVSLETGRSHFEDCPDAARWSKRRRQPGAQG